MYAVYWQTEPQKSCTLQSIQLNSELTDYETNPTLPSCDHINSTKCNR